MYDGTRVVGSATITATSRAPDHRVTLATGVGSLPGTDISRGGPSRRRRAARPPAPARAAGAGRRRRSMTGRGLAIVAELGADLQPAGWRLTGRSGVRPRPPPRSQPARPGPRHPGGGAPGLRRATEGPGRRTVDARRDRRATARRQGPRRPRRPARPGPGAGRGGARRTWPTYAAGYRRRSPRAPGRRARPRRGARAREVPTASGFGRHRAVDRPELSEHLGVGLRRRHGVRGRAVGARVRTRHARSTCCAAPALADCRWTSPCSRPADHDVLGEALEAGDGVALGLVPSVDPATPPTEPAP